jgi:glycosyltransferase involved in cell wall biosynthesis
LIPFLSQDFKSWEHIIVDDGSTDGTEEEVTRRAVLDPRIRYIKRTSTRSGANVCRNLGVRESRGDLIIFLDSDDLLSPHCLSNRVEALLRNPGLDFAVFPGWVFSEKLGDLGSRLFSPGQLETTWIGFFTWTIPGRSQAPYGVEPHWKDSAVSQITFQVGKTWICTYEPSLPV